MRTEDPRKFAAIVEASAIVFARFGFKRAQMGDIAAEAHVALGTLYRYSKSKEALFDAAVRWGFGEDLVRLRGRLDRARPTRRAVVDFVRRQADETDYFPLLTQCVESPDLDTADADLVRITEEVFGSMNRYYLAISIVEQSVTEWPELARVFDQHMRSPLLDRLERFLKVRCAAGVLRSPPDLRIGARFLLELCAEFTKGRKMSPSGDNYTDDDTALQTVVYFVQSGFGRSRRPSPPPRSIVRSS